MPTGPRSNKRRALQGVRKKKKEKAQAKEKKTADPKDQIESARDALTNEILSRYPEDLRKVFNLYAKGVEPMHLIGLVGVEIARVQAKQLSGAEDYRDAAHFHRLLDQARRIQQMHTGSDAFIPDKITVEIASHETEEEDVSDQPEYT